MKVVADTSDTKKLFQVLDKYISDGFLQFKEHGLEIRVCTPDTVALLDVEVKADWFNEYEVETARKIGINMASLYSVFRKLDKSEEVTFDVDEASQKFQVKQDGDTLQLPILDLDEEDLENIPDPTKIELGTSFELVCGQFRDKTGKVVFMDEPLEFQASEKGLRILADGNRHSGEVNLDVENFEGEEVTAMYASDYIGMVSDTMKKLYPRDADVRIRIDDENPINLGYEEENFQLDILIAPRIPEGV